MTPPLTHNRVVTADAPRGFGGRTFSADGRTIRVEPSEVRKENGRTNVSLGFPFATLEEYVDPDTVAADLAEYLSCPKRAAAPELYEALEDALKFILGDISGESQRIGIIKAGTDALVKADGEQP